MRNFILTFLLGFITVASMAQMKNGYNIAHMFQPFPNHTINSEAIQLFDRLEPDIMRFPGGSIANKYHYYKPGYGWSKPDMKRKENYIVEFVRVMKAMKKQPDVIFVMNLFDHFKGANEANLIKENMDALKYLLDNGMNVIAVELGNEFYLYNEIIGLPGITHNPEANNIDLIEIGQEDNTQNNGNNNPKDNNGGNGNQANQNNESILIKWLRMLTGKGKSNSQFAAGKAVNNNRLQKYLRLAKIYDTKINTQYPRIKTGAPIGNFKNKKHTEYNNFVLKNFGFVDAFVPHSYGSYNKNCKDNKCVKEGLDWSIRAVVEPKLKYIRDNTNKEIWVTEWNALKFGHWGDEGAWLRNGEVHKEYTIKFIKLFEKYGVTISNFHKLTGPMTGSAYNAIDVDKGKCHPTPIYDVLVEHY